MEMKLYRLRDASFCPLEVCVIILQHYTHHLRYAHFCPLPVEARLAGRAQPAGGSLAQARILIAPCNEKAQPPCRHSPISSISWGIDESKKKMFPLDIIKPHQTELKVNVLVDIISLFVVEVPWGDSLFLGVS